MKADARSGSKTSFPAAPGHVRYYPDGDRHSDLPSGRDEPNSELQILPRERASAMSDRQHLHFSFAKLSGCCKRLGMGAVAGRIVRVLDDDDLLELLRSRVKSAGGQKAFARQHGVERRYVNMVLNGKKAPGCSIILEALNLRVVCAPVEHRSPADGRLLDHDDVLRLLHSRVKDAGGQAAFSKQGVDRAHLNLVLNRKRRVSSSIIDALNLRVVYAPIGGRQRATEFPSPRRSLPTKV
jgi:hypothetical protein